MEKIVVDLEVRSNKGVKDVKNLNKEISNTKTEAKGASDSLDKVSGGAIGKFNGLKGSIGGVVKGFKSLKFAIIASGIGALLLAVVAVGKAFTSSEEGQNKFAKIMGVIGSVTGNLVDMLATLGENIISVFENPKQAIIDLKNLIVENITNRFNAIIDTLGFLGSAFKKVFSGDFSGAMDDAKKAGSSYVDALTGVKDTLSKVTEGVKEMSNEIAKDAKAAANIADQRAKADKLDRKLITERAEANRKRAELLDKAAQKEKFTAAERIKFLEDAGKIEDDITAKEIRAAQLRYEAKVVENSLSKSTKEDLDKEAELKAKLINLETAKLTKQKLVSSQVVGAKREEAAEIKAIEDKAIADRKAIEELEANTEEEKRALKLQKEKEKFEEAIVLATEQGISTQELERSQKESLQVMRDEFALIDTNRELKIASDKKAISDAQIKIDKDEANNKKILLQQGLNDAKSTLGGIMSLAKEGSAVGKAAAIAQATISGVQGVQNAYSTAQASPITALFPAYPLVQAGLAGAVSLKNIAAIKSGSASTKPTVSAPPQSPNPATQAPNLSQPPAFNVVGASGTNQLASAIGGQSQQPTRTYVVAGDVSTAQELDRNIVTGAAT